ncbi:hypothetical protein MNEG_2824 [Monoraphidium neglectum]|uniref:Uncharacterized protein n=1 Tax=Monoraphidium neglectum TaxID=145388 RepID=A0A0D2MRC3_9CHLO|nr:hypothetical protein MNEG_2824 [Monoraphidium neglectum]KIZ05130.1 hypothetical protein MNEG_2824 [Monoraphidium neglectum]|eukprot:XP_013904149.1 hypothetical protein MNEG_2824 [Monoraphidium neglectum]
MSEAYKEDRKQEVAQEKYNANFEELSGKERQSVGGTVGGEMRREQMGEGKGGDVHAAYAEMGSKGGQATGGDTQ